MRTINQQEIDEIGRRRFKNPNDAILTVNKIAKGLKDTLIERIKNLSADRRPQELLSYAELWKPSFEWSITHEVSCSNEELSIHILYKLDLSRVNVDNLLNEAIRKIEDKLSTKILKYSEKALLTALYSHYKHLSNCTGLEISSKTEDKRKSIEEDIEYLIDMYFDVRLVNFEGNYANGDYFDIYESNISHPITLKKALVADDGIRCLEKGTYCSPLNNKKI